MALDPLGNFSLPTANPLRRTCCFDQSGTSNYFLKRKTEAKACLNLLINKTIA
jgi:hypothetical protein